MKICVLSDSHDRAPTVAAAVAGLGAPATWVLADLTKLKFEVRYLE